MRGRLAALAVIGGGIGLVYVFVGPTSAIGPSLVAAALAAALIWLRLRPAASKGTPLVAKPGAGSPTSRGGGAGLAES